MLISFALINGREIMAFKLNFFLKKEAKEAIFLFCIYLIILETSQLNLS